MITRFERFTAAIAGIYRDVQKIEREEMEKYGLKGAYAQYLVVMDRHPEGITAARLCEICEKDKAAISRILAELEQAGMILREQRNGTRYRANLTLTAKGKAAAAAVSEKARLAVEQAGDGLDDAQREVFYRVLALISDNLHAICKDGIKSGE